MQMFWPSNTDCINTSCFKHFLLRVQSVKFHENLYEISSSSPRKMHSNQTWSSYFVSNVCMFAFDANHLFSRLSWDSNRRLLFITLLAEMIGQFSSSNMIQNDEIRIRLKLFRRVIISLLLSCYQKPTRDFASFDLCVQERRLDVSPMTTSSTLSNSVKHFCLCRRVASCSRLHVLLSSLVRARFLTSAYWRHTHSQRDGIRRGFVWLMLLVQRNVSLQ